MYFISKFILKSIINRVLRFVNGYADQHPSLPVYKMAKKIGMPSHFVELRHSATHQSLPSIQLLRNYSSQALTWLWNTYWTNLENSGTNESGTATSVNNTDEIEKIRAEITSQFKKWKKLRKSNVRAPIDTENDKALSKIITTLGKHCTSHPKEVIYVMFHKNILIPK